jgi:hypothetical protein
VSALAASMARMLECHGACGAMLVDGTTGLTYSRAGDQASLPDPGRIRDEVELIAEVLGTHATGGQLENVVVTTGTHHCLTRVIPRERGDDLLLVVALTRELTNLALAERQVDSLARNVLA